MISGKKMAVEFCTIRIEVFLLGVIFTISRNDLYFKDFLDFQKRPIDYHRLVDIDHFSTLRL